MTRQPSEVRNEAGGRDANQRRGGVHRAPASDRRRRGGGERAAHPALPDPLGRWAREHLHACRRGGGPREVRVAARSRADYPTAVCGTPGGYSPGVDTGGRLTGVVPGGVTTLT